MNKAQKAFTFVVSAALLANVLIVSACTPNEPEVQTDEYAVTLQYQDETSRPRVLYVEKGGSISTPAEPVRVGYQLSEWTDGETGGNTITFPYKPESDVTLYAQWEAASYEVTFDYGIEQVVNHKITKKYNEQLTEENVNEVPAQTKDGYEFLYWVTKAGSNLATDKVTLPYTVKKNVTFYAAWMEEGLTRFSLNFDANYEGAEEIEPIEIIEGNSLELRDVPTPARAGCTLLGWSFNKDATDESEVISFPYTPSKEDADGNNINLYAVWERETYTIRYYYNYQDSPADEYKVEQVLGGEVLESGYELTRNQSGVEFTFDGWWTNTVGGTKIEFPYTVTDHISLFAQWKAPLTPMAQYDNKFDAEFTPISPTTVYPGYSNSLFGTECIGKDKNQNSFSATYPLIGTETANAGHFVFCMYKKGLTVTYNIYSSKRATRVPLYANLGVELVEFATMTPDGNYGFSFIVNGETIDYSPINIEGGNNVSSTASFMGTFKEYRIGNVTLNEGWNTIVLMTNNSTNIGGTTQGWAPMIDYIRLDAGTKTELSWHPEYDNLYRVN